MSFEKKYKKRRTGLRMSLTNRVMAKMHRLSSEMRSTTMQIAKENFETMQKKLRKRRKRKHESNNQTQTSRERGSDYESPSIASASDLSKSSKTSKSSTSAKVLKKRHPVLKRSCHFIENKTMAPEKMEKKESKDAPSHD